MHLNSILTNLALSTQSVEASALQIRHRWFLVVFFVCAAIVLSNVVHYVLFRLLRRKEAQSATLGIGLQRHLGRPARAIFLLTCLMAVLPSIPDLPFNLNGILRQAFIMAIVVAMGWFAVGLVYVLQAALMRRYDIRRRPALELR